MRETVATALLLGLLIVPTVLAQDKPDTVERPFAAGGVINMELSAGEYRITGTSSGQIRVSWRTRRPGDARKVRVAIDSQGPSAFVRTTGPKDGFHVDIEIPQKATLNVNLSAGDLQIRSVDGSKDVSVWAGDVGIEVGDTSRYRRVDASVRFGDLNARAFNVDTGGIFRSFNWDGKGSYELRARLFAGDLTLHR